MRITRRWLGSGAFVLGLSALGGCQTYFGGMTLPSPHYLKHSPQYFPEDPAFPLQRERDSMLDPDGAIRRGVAAPAGAAVAPALPPLGAGVEAAPVPAAPLPGR